MKRYIRSDTIEDMESEYSVVHNFRGFYVVYSDSLEVIAGPFEDRASALEAIPIEEVKRPLNYNHPYVEYLRTKADYYSRGVYEYKGGAYKFSEKPSNYVGDFDIQVEAKSDAQAVYLIRKEIRKQLDLEASVPIIIDKTKITEVEDYILEQ